jgi:hypothetical protein
VIVIDDSHWPLVVFTFGGTVTAREIDHYLEGMGRLFSTGERGIGLVLTDDLKPFDVALIRRLAQWNQANEARLRAQSIGTALVLPSPMVRGLLRAILWMHPIPQPYAVFSTTEEAMVWVRDMVRRAGIEMRPSFTQGPVPAPL